MNILQMSISAGVMILVITTIRALAINCLPKRTFLVLWGIVMARLLLPFSCPSPLSFYSLINYSNILVSSAPSAGILINSDKITTASFPDFSLLVWIWGIGMALCVLYFIVAYFKCHCEFKDSCPIENIFTVQWLKNHKCNRSISIHQTCCISAPLTFGIFRPVILMPIQTDWADARKMEYVLEHEYVHIQHFDGITKLIMITALCVHWFNPLVWAMYILVNRDIELSCDEKVIRIFGENVKSAYALTLINMEERKSALFPLCNNFSKNAIEERIEAIMKTRRGTKSAIIIACALVVITIMVFATSSVQAEKNNRIKMLFTTAHESAVLTEKENEAPLPQFVTSEILLLDDKTIQDHDISPNETMVYKTSDNQELNFNKGDSGSLNLQIIDREFDRGQFVSIGYMHDGVKIPLLEEQIKSKAVVDFIAPDNGLYAFYIECNSSDPLLVENFTVK